jgi:extradiol dioxygenase family protein
METTYITKMSAGKMSSPTGSKIIEQRHTGSEIISRAEEVLAKELGQDLADYAGLEEVCSRGAVGENTVWGYVDNTGNNVDFNETRKLKAAIAVLNVNGHYFEATPVS